MKHENRKEELTTEIIMEIAIMRFEWIPEYGVLAAEFLKKHFGDSQGVTSYFPCMRNEYTWGSHRPDVLDSRVPAKNNTEYHGFEKHAMQYHVTAQYEYAYHHWMLAACWREGDMEVNGFHELGHINAVKYAIKQALYNKALYEWQAAPRTKKLPQPEDFDLNPNDVENKENKAQQEIDCVVMEHNINAK